jgi:hypothetical protein
MKSRKLVHAAKKYSRTIRQHSSATSALLCTVTNADINKEIIQKIGMVKPSLTLLEDVLVLR